MNHEPFALRDHNNQPAWYIIVAGRQFGPWDNKGAALAGYETELRREKDRKE